MTIYLDHNASTPILPEVLDAMLPFLRGDAYGNPSSQHPYGRRARQGIDAARERVARAIGAHPDEIVFTSGGTEASNLAIRGVGARRVTTTSVEHPATLEPCARLERDGVTVARMGVDGEGRASVAELDADLVTIIHAHNETGVVQPVAEIAASARARGALVHTDAAQSVGKIRVDVGELGVDLLSIAGHKLHAPKGVGALFVRRGVRLARLLDGAGHERGLRPGTENVASIVGLGAACELVTRDLDSAAARMAALRDRLWDGLRLRVEGIARSGSRVHVLPNTLSVRFRGVIGADVLTRAPEIAASTGSACHEGAHEPPHAIVAMGIASEDALGTVRLSLGRTTTPDEIDLAIEALARAALPDGSI